MEKYLLEMRNIHKRFPGVYALKGVNLNLRSGEVMAIVGENGAGKSTLINVLGGIHPMNEGEILIDGERVEIVDEKAAMNHGISIIHQELVLVPYMTVAENIFMNREPVRGYFVDHERMRREAQEYIDDLGLNIRSDEIVANLSIAEQQMVEITKAVSFNSRIVVMDEPTSSISEKDTAALFENIRKLKKKGIGIIYISHRLSELQEIADRVTIFRDGQSVSCHEVKDVTNDEIVQEMVGREVVNYYTRTWNEPGKCVLEVRNVSSRRVNNVSFDIHEGEIVGFAGLVGSGRSELIHALLGLDEITSGEVMMEGEQVHFDSPEKAYARGIGYIPESRRDESLFGVMSVRFNTSIRVMPEFIHGIHVDSAYENTLTQKYIEDLKIKTPGQEAMIQNLSGGNQQKVIIGRWLATKPKLLIMDEPTRGIDVGTKAEIYELMNDLAQNGMAIIMISSELPEIINMSDRVVVMREGEVSRILPHEQISQNEIMKYAVNI